MKYSYENRAAAESVVVDIIAALNEQDSSGNYALGYLTGIIGTLASKDDSVLSELVDILDYIENKVAA
jgi:hypothetical protein